VQFPIPTSVTSPVVVVVQMSGVELVNVTARPLVAVAIICTGDWLNVTAAGCAKVIVCACGAATSGIGCLPCMTDRETTDEESAAGSLETPVLPNTAEVGVNTKRRSPIKDRRRCFTR